MAKEVLDRRALREVRRLNSAFLALLCHCQSSPLAGKMDGRSGLLDRIVALSPGHAKVLCSAKVALFSLRMDWPGSGHPSGVAENSLAPDQCAADRLVREFGLVASGFAWHLSQTSPLATSLLLGWSRARAREFSALSLADVVRGNLACSPAVRLRLCRHPRFWPDLIRSATHENGRGWEVKQTWSTQFVSPGRRPGSGV
jgi:hypothetical protein